MFNDSNYEISIDFTWQKCCIFRYVFIVMLCCNRIGVIFCVVHVPVILSHFLLAFLVIIGLFRWVFLLNLVVCLVLPPPLAPSLLSLPPTWNRVWIPFLLIFASSISNPYPNQGLYLPAMTGVQLVRGWGSLWLWKKKRRLVWCEEQWWLALGEWLWDSNWWATALPPELQCGLISWEAKNWWA